MIIIQEPAELRMDVISIEQTVFDILNGQVGCTLEYSLSDIIIIQDPKIEPPSLRSSHATVFDLRL